MSFFNWFRRPLRVVRLLTGKRGKCRWTARIDGELVAVSPARGYANLQVAQAMAKHTLGSGWEYKVDKK